MSNDRSWEFKIFGPFKIEKTKVGNPIQKNALTSIFDKEAKGLDKQIGCYIFGIRASQGITPWYVGQTTNCFKSEIATPPNIVKYNNAFNRVQHGTPVMFFLAHPNKKGPNNLKFIEQLERYLIQSAYEKNPKVENKHGIFDPDWRIGGFLGTGKASRKEVKAFRRLMGW